LQIYKIIMICPSYLKQGDKIGIVSSAKKVTSEEIQPAVNTLKSWGLEVVLGENLFNSYNQFAGNDIERTSDFQSMLNDDSIKAILCSRGGYGTVRIIDIIDFENFAKCPKWVIGFSDITVLHSHIHTNYGIETLHAPMAINFIYNGNLSQNVSSLKNALFGNEISYKIQYNTLNRAGSAKGILVGGNLSILYSIIGTKSDIDTDGKILFIEDVDEYLYHLDRMMMNLKRSGLLSNLKGLLVGAMTTMNDNEISFGKTAEEIIAEAVSEYEYPVCFDFSAGHIKENLTLIFGRKVSMEVMTSGCNLKFEG